jgi:protein phosphatase 1 regulatory subunit 10
VTPYGSSPQWPPSVPLSSYSSLNGATTTTDGQAASPQMVIELSISNDSPKPPSDTCLSSPALTMGTPPTTSATQPYALSSRSPYQSYHNPTMAINPAFVHSFSPPQQNAQSPPRTLSPYALHAPSPPVETISPAAFYQQSTPSTSTTPPRMLRPPLPTSLPLKPARKSSILRSGHYFSLTSSLAPAP